MCMISDTSTCRNNAQAEALINGLERIGSLSDQERSLLEGASFAVQHMGGNRDLVREGDRPSHCSLLLDGFACRYKTLENGQRQIVAFHVPTEFCDLTSLILGTLDYSVATLTPAKVVSIPHATILGWITQLPSLGDLLWQATLVDASVAREWVVNAGRRTAYQRTAHLLCELSLQMRSAGQANERTCRLPLTQVVLADALGLTPVHVNRTLRWLRGEDLIEFSGGVLTVLDWPGLKRAGGFAPAYLHHRT